MRGYRGFWQLSIDRQMRSWIPSIIVSKLELAVDRKLYGDTMARRSVNHLNIFALCALFVVALACSAPARALPSGSPVCTTTTAEMNNSMGQRLGDNPSGWRIETGSATYSPGGTAFNVRVAHPSNRSFKGLLLWAVDANNLQVGQWENIPSGFHTVANCNERSLSHLNSNLKFSPSPYFQLALPIEVRGQITVQAFIVEGVREAHYEVLSHHIHLDVLRNDLDIDTSRTQARYHALTDGVLVIRYLLGLTGAVLTSDAKASTALRTDTEIESQIEFLRANGALDVDGDGSTRAETDGVLIIRYLFGFRGSALVEGANGGSLGSQAIAANISLLMP